MILILGDGNLIENQKRETNQLETDFNAAETAINTPKSIISVRTNKAGVGFKVRRLPKKANKACPEIVAYKKG